MDMSTELGSQVMDPPVSPSVQLLDDPRKVSIGIVSNIVKGFCWMYLLPPSRTMRPKTASSLRSDSSVQTHTLASFEASSTQLYPDQSPEVLQTV